MLQWVQLTLRAASMSRTTQPFTRRRLNYPLGDHTTLSMNATLSKLTGTFMIRAAEKEHAETTAETDFVTWTSDSNTMSEPLLGGYQQAATTPMLDWGQCSAVERVPGTVSRAWVFK